MKREIDFLITQKCNYRCPYCSQSKKFAKGAFEYADNSVLEAFFEFIQNLPRDFEITISGGEPFCHENFFQIIEKIVYLGFKVGVVSNFSFPFEYYLKLKEIAGENLSRLFVSLHLTEIKNLDDFLHKAQEFSKIKGNTEFVAASVLSEDNLCELEKVAQFMEKNGIKFEVQHMRIKNSFVEYSFGANEFIQKFSVSKTKKLSNTYANLCCAGVDYMCVYQNGDAYRCFSSRFNRAHFMGNIKDKNFKMFSKPIPCLNKNCTCPKPILNGLVDFKHKNMLFAFALSFYNLFFIPYFICKHFSSIKAKLSQGFYFKSK